MPQVGTVTTPSRSTRAKSQFATRGRTLSGSGQGRLLCPAEPLISPQNRHQLGKFAETAQKIRPIGPALESATEEPPVWRIETDPALGLVVTEAAAPPKPLASTIVPTPCFVETI